MVPTKDCGLVSGGVGWVGWSEVGLYACPPGACVLGLDGRVLGEALSTQLSPRCTGEQEHSFHPPCSSLPNPCSLLPLQVRRSHPHLCDAFPCTEDRGGGEGEP